MVGSEADIDVGADAGALVRAEASRGGSMRTVTRICKEVEQLIKEGGDVKSCCRSIAKKLGVREEDVQVVMAGYRNEYYLKLGFNVQNKI